MRRQVTPLSYEGGALLSLVDALPPTTVLVDRAVLERVREALRRVDAEADHASDCQAWGEPGTATQDDGCSCYIEATTAALAALEAVLVK